MVIGPKVVISCQMCPNTHTFGNLSRILFLAEPVFWTAVHHAVAEAETVVVHRLAQDGGRRPFRIEVGIAAGKSLKNLWGPPPTTPMTTGTSAQSAANLSSCRTRRYWWVRTKWGRCSGRTRSWSSACRCSNRAILEAAESCRNVSFHNPDDQ